MVTGYANYRVEIKNVKFIADDGRMCPRTAIVTLIGHEGGQGRNSAAADAGKEDFHALILPVMRVP